METTKKVSLVSFAALAVYIGMQIYKIAEVSPLTQLKNEWWGPDLKTTKQTTGVIPFTINVSDEVLKDLRYRLNNSKKFTPPLEGVQNQYGFNTNMLKQVLDYWLEKYDWRIREDYLNQFPQFKTNIQGLNIHFIHIKPNVTPIFPLLILHGWPGSVREFYKLIPILTKTHEKYGFAFEVVAPSLPGFAFSDGATKPGLGPIEMGVVMKNLMRKLGHEKFYVQGGDWGALIVKQMATFFPEHVSGLHTNFFYTNGPKFWFKLIIGSFFPDLLMPSERVNKLYPLLENAQNFIEMMGYFHILATRPDTVGVGLNDSPSGLAAFILEKIATVSDPFYKRKDNAGLLERFTYDELVDNIMFYWITESSTTAARIYAEAMSNRQYSFIRKNVDPKVPCALARFPHDILYFPEWIVRDVYVNLVQVTDFEKGGHFAAFEVPELLAEDVFSAIAKMTRLHELDNKN